MNPFSLTAMLHFVPHTRRDICTLQPISQLFLTNVGIKLQNVAWRWIRSWVTNDERIYLTSRPKQTNMQVSFLQPNQERRRYEKHLVLLPVPCLNKCRLNLDGLGRVQRQGIHDRTAPYTAKMSLLHMTVSSINAGKVARFWNPNRTTQPLEFLVTAKAALTCVGSLVRRPRGSQ